MLQSIQLTYDLIIKIIFNSILVKFLYTFRTPSSLCFCLKVVKDINSRFRFLGSLQINSRYLHLAYADPLCYTPTLIMEDFMTSVINVAGKTYHSLSTSGKSLLLGFTIICTFLLWFMSYTCCVSLVFREL